MPRHFSTFLARRFLIPRGLFIVVINGVSVLGVTLAVAVLIVVLSVMKGFENAFREALLGFEPHIVLQKTLPDEEPQHEDIEPAYLEAVRILKEIHGVIGASPFIEGPVLVAMGGRIKAAGLKAIRPDDEQLRELETRGMYDPDDPASGDLNLERLVVEEGIFERIIVSRSVADGFAASRYGPGLRVGDFITIYSPADFERIRAAFEKNKELPPEKRRDPSELVEELSTPPEFYVTGIVDSPLYKDFAITSLQMGQELFNMAGSNDVHGIAVFAEEPYQIVELQQRIDARLPSNEFGIPVWQSMNWAQRYRGRLNALELERRMIAVLMFFIMIVAGFCIMNTSMVTTMQRRRDIGIMKAMGARVGQIVQVFVLQSHIVGLIGTGVGLVLGLIILRFLEPIRSFMAKFQADPFPVETYGLTKIPSEIIPLTIAIICVAAITACTLAAVGPAWVVARLDAAKALRSGQ